MDETLFDTSPFEAPFELVQLVRPCPGCKQLETVRARFLVAANRIEARCRCRHEWALDHSTYGHLFGVRARKLKHRLNHDDDEFVPRDPPYVIFNRYSYRCVYHEGSEEAKRLRLKQVDAISSRLPQMQTSLSFDDERLRDAMVGTGFDEDVARNLFGLVPDHLIPRKFTRALWDKLNHGQREKCCSEWIVSACVWCNEERKTSIEKADSLLFIYSRYVMPHRGKLALQRLADASDFVGVLNEMALLIASRSSIAG